MLLIYSDPKIRLIGEGIISLRVNPWCEVLLGETKGNKRKSVTYGTEFILVYMYQEQFNIIQKSFVHKLENSF